nr:acyl carrier protein 1, chloroplastic-like [Ipomoea batatas]
MVHAPFTPPRAASCAAVSSSSGDSFTNLEICSFTNGYSSSPLSSSCLRTRSLTCRRSNERRATMEFQSATGSSPAPDFFAPACSFQKRCTSCRGKGTFMRSTNRFTAAAAVSGREKSSQFSQNSYLVLYRTRLGTLGHGWTMRTVNTTGKQPARRGGLIREGGLVICQVSTTTYSDEVSEWGSRIAVPSIRISNAARRRSSQQIFKTAISCSIVAEAETLETVRSTIAKQLSIDESAVTPQTKFAELGADSLDTVEIMMALEERFGVSIGEGGAENVATVQDAADLIQNVIANAA